MTQIWGVLNNFSLKSISILLTSTGGFLTNFPLKSISIHYWLDENFPIKSIYWIVVFHNIKQPRCIMDCGPFPPPCSSVQLLSNWRVCGLGWCRGQRSNPPFCPARSRRIIGGYIWGPKSSWLKLIGKP